MKKILRICLALMMIFAISFGAGQFMNFLKAKLDKTQTTANADKLLYLDNAGNTSPLKVGDGFAVGKSTGKNIVFGEWEPGRYEADGSYTAYTNLAKSANIAINERFPVKPGAAYTLSLAGFSNVEKAVPYIQQYDENGEFISQLKYFWYPSSNDKSATIKLSEITAYISICFYTAETITTWNDIVPVDFMIEEGNVATEYEPHYMQPESIINIETMNVYDKMAAAGLLPERVNVPEYYFADNYLPAKISRIRELLDGCAGNGDAFFFVTDQHWELNARQSPALINYIAENVHIPRVFTGGDTADAIHEQYANALSAAYDGDIYHCMGNHDWFGTMDGNKLAYIFDMGKPEQIGNTKRHYYYVDNPQQSIRYIVLNAYSNETGILGSAYDTEQIEWLRNVALKVDDSWTVLVITHSLYYGFGEEASFDPAPAGASEVIEVLDNATCDVACVLSGNAHLDRICHTPGGIPVVVTTSDKYSPWVDSGTDMEPDSGTDMEPWLTKSRTKGTITEQAFDVVVLDKEQRKLTFVRIGAPADNWTDGVSTGTVEERVVMY